MSLRAREWQLISRFKSKPCLSRPFVPGAIDSKRQGVKELILDKGSANRVSSSLSSCM